MWRALGVLEQDWAATPQAVRTVLLALQQQVRLMGIRFSAYEKQLAEAGPVDEARGFARQQMSRHVDETGWREGRRLKRPWINRTADVTAIEVLEARIPSRWRFRCGRSCGSKALSRRITPPSVA
jgi:hypothetical protein